MVLFVSTWFYLFPRGFNCCFQTAQTVWSARITGPSVPTATRAVTRPLVATRAARSTT